MRKRPGWIGRTARRYWYVLPLVWLLRGARRRKPQEPPTDKPPAYFAGGQATLMVRHTRGWDGDTTKVIDLLRENRLLKQLGGAFERPVRVYTFRDDESDPFSLVALDLGDKVRDDDLARLINEITAGTRNTEQPENARVEAITANWLANCTSHQWSVGGPGALPVPTSFREGTEPWKFDRAGDATGVRVAVLDTIPCQWQLAQAYEHWHTTHPLIDELLRPNSLLHRQHLPYEQAIAIHDWPIKDHMYNIADHGMFAAGVVHSVARNAEIHLIEVLGPTGVGTLESLIWGLQQALELARDGQPLVVNCSLMLALPDDEQQLANLKNNSVVGVLSDEALAAQLEPLREVCRLLVKRGACLVAAAGNDAQGQSVPYARYPAALEMVHGVAALDHTDVRASYSNYPERRNEVGVATFGGATTATGRADDQHGMLGIFTGAFPPDVAGTTENSNGWARWAGTSFAAPVISGLLAVAYKETGNCKAAWRVIEDMTSTIAQHSNVVLVKQG